MSALLRLATMRANSAVGARPAAPDSRLGALLIEKRACGHPDDWVGAALQGGTHRSQFPGAETGAEFCETKGREHLLVTSKIPDD